MKFIKEFLNSRRSVIEIFIVAILITLGINLITSASFEIFTFENKDKVFFYTGITIVIISIPYFVLKILWKTSITKEFTGFIIIDKKTKMPVECDGYNYSEELRRIFEAGFAENKALEHIWTNESTKFTDRNKLVIEATEYFLIDDLSTHLTDYFNTRRLDNKQLIEFSRNDIPDILLSNRFLEMFSKPREQRASFVKYLNDDDSPGRVISSITKEGTIFKEFDFVLPKGSSVSRKDNKMLLNTKRFVIEFEIIYGGFGNVLPRDFEELYLGYTSYKDYSTTEITVNINVRFKFKSLFSHLLSCFEFGTIDQPNRGAAIASLGIEICIFDLPTKFHRLPFTFTHRVFKPAVITATRYIQYSTHHLDRPFLGMILYKLINQRSLVEMMPKAFFNMSRSVSASLRRFSNSITLPASPSRERTPLPGKLFSPCAWYSLRQRYNSVGDMPNSCASSETFFRSRLSLTAFSLNALS
jgi:hypothetical protein